MQHTTKPYEANITKQQYFTPHTNSQSSMHMQHTTNSFIKSHESWNTEHQEANSKASTHQEGFSSDGKLFFYRDLVMDVETSARRKRICISFDTQRYRFILKLNPKQLESKDPELLDIIKRMVNNNYDTLKNLLKEHVPVEQFENDLKQYHTDDIVYFNGLPYRLEVEYIKTPSLRYAFDSRHSEAVIERHPQSLVLMMVPSEHARYAGKFDLLYKQGYYSHELLEQLPVLLTDAAARSYNLKYGLTLEAENKELDDDVIFSNSASSKYEATSVSATSTYEASGVSAASPYESAHIKDGQNSINGIAHTEKASLGTSQTVDNSLQKFSSYENKQIALSAGADDYAADMPDYLNTLFNKFISADSPEYSKFDPQKAAAPAIGKNKLTARIPVQEGLILPPRHMELLTSVYMRRVALEYAWTMDISQDDDAFRLLAEHYSKNIKLLTHLATCDLWSSLNNGTLCSHRYFLDPDNEFLKYYIRSANDAIKYWLAVCWSFSLGLLTYHQHNRFIYSDNGWYWPFSRMAKNIFERQSYYDTYKKPLHKYKQEHLSVLQVTDEHQDDKFTAKAQSKVELVSKDETQASAQEQFNYSLRKQHHSLGIFQKDQHLEAILNHDKGLTAHEIARSFLYPHEEHLYHDVFFKFHEAIDPQYDQCAEDIRIYDFLREADLIKQPGIFLSPEFLQMQQWSVTGPLLRRLEMLKLLSISHSEYKEEQLKDVLFDKQLVPEQYKTYLLLRLFSHNDLYLDFGSCETNQMFYPQYGSDPNNPERPPKSLAWWPQGKRKINNPFLKGELSKFKKAKTSKWGNGFFDAENCSANWCMLAQYMICHDQQCQQKREDKVEDYLKKQQQKLRKQQEQDLASGAGAVPFTQQSSLASLPYAMLDTRAQNACSSLSQAYKNACFTDTCLQQESLPHRLLQQEDQSSKQRSESMQAKNTVGSHDTENILKSREENPATQANILSGPKLFKEVFRSKEGIIEENQPLNFNGYAPTLKDLEERKQKQERYAAELKQQELVLKQNLDAPLGSKFNLACNLGKCTAETRKLGVEAILLERAGLQYELCLQLDEGMLDTYGEQLLHKFALNKDPVVMEYLNTDTTKRFKDFKQKGMKYKSQQNSNTYQSQTKTTTAQSQLDSSISSCSDQNIALSQIPEDTTTEDWLIRHGNPLVQPNLCHFKERMLLPDMCWTIGANGHEIDPAEALVATQDAYIPDIEYINKDNYLQLTGVPFVDALQALDLDYGALFSEFASDIALSMHENPLFKNSVWKPNYWVNQLVRPGVIKLKIFYSRSKELDSDFERQYRFDTLMMLFKERLLRQILRCVKLFQPVAVLSGEKTLPELTLCELGVDNLSLPKSLNSLEALFCMVTGGKIFERCIITQGMTAQGRCSRRYEASRKDYFYVLSIDQYVSAYPIIFLIGLVAHELTHLGFFDHSARFKSSLNMLCPFYNEVESQAYRLSFTLSKSPKTLHLDSKIDVALISRPEPIANGINRPYKVTLQNLLKE